MAVITIATAELEFLLELVATQDARITTLEAENDYLHRERILRVDGPDELLRRYVGASTGEPAPPGYAHGNSGQRADRPQAHLRDAEGAATWRTLILLRFRRRCRIAPSFVLATYPP